MYDVLAVGAVQAALEARMSVPNDVAICGCEQTAMSRASPVPLTTCDTQTSLLSQRMLMLLDAQITNLPDAPMSATVDPILMTRRSTSAGA